MSKVVGPNPPIATSRAHLAKVLSATSLTVTGIHPRPNRIGCPTSTGHDNSTEIARPDSQKNNSGDPNWVRPATAIEYRSRLALYSFVAERSLRKASVRTTFVGRP